MKNSEPYFPMNALSSNLWRTGDYNAQSSCFIYHRLSGQKPLALVIKKSSTFANGVTKSLVSIRRRVHRKSRRMSLLSRLRSLNFSSRRRAEFYDFIITTLSKATRLYTRRLKCTMQSAPEANQIVETCYLLIVNLLRCICACINVIFVK